MTKWLNTLEYKFRRLGISNLMIYITGTMLAVYLAENLMRAGITEYLYLSREAVMQGEIWRLITFIFVPPQNSTLWVFVTLYFYYFIGTALENAWGSTKFTIFYAFGVIGAIIAAMISGYGNNMYLNLSMFLAFAALYPEQQLLLFFVIPVKVKILAYIDLALLLMSFIGGSWSVRAAIVFSLVNVIIFFSDSFTGWIQNYKRRMNYKKSMKRQKDMYGN